VLPAALVSAALCLSAQPAQELLLDSGFEDGLTGWSRQGQAEFDSDADNAHGGAACARIRVAAGVEPQYQQLFASIGAGARGDEILVRLWVRTGGVEGPGCAYGALEFLDGADQRCGIAHSKIDVNNGANGWEEVIIMGAAPLGTVSARIDLVLHAVGTAWFDDVTVARTGRLKPWPDLGDALRRVTIDTGDVVQADFRGVGFHVFDHEQPVSQEELETIIAKRWRELNPSFARLNHSLRWSPEQLSATADYILRLKGTGTEVYLTTWDPPVTEPGAEREAWARKVADDLEYLVRERGCFNLRWYCMTNELSLGAWGSLASDLPTFRDYHQVLYEELRRRNLDVGLLATDAAPITYWNTIEWATQNMDDITAIYGGHHYINDYDLADERFFPWFLSKLQWGVSLAKSRGKQFILGEFGCKQDGSTVNGKLNDACANWDTPREPLVGIQLCEAAISAIDAGAYAMGNWTFADFPDDYSPTYQNKWGTSKRTEGDWSTRDHYYAYGLLTRFFRGPATVYGVRCDDPYVRVAAVRHEGGTWSIAVINRYHGDVPLEIAAKGAELTGTFRKYVYDPAHVPQNRFGDMQPASGTIEAAGGTLADTIAGGTLAVYTTAYHPDPPSAATGVRVTHENGRTVVTWDPVPEPDVCYYRVYLSLDPKFTPSLDTQAGSTIAEHFEDPLGMTTGYWRVVAVDQSGNAGPASECMPPGT